MKKLAIPAAGMLLALSMSSAQALTVIDSFDFGVTTVIDTANGFGSTTAAGINAAIPTGDPARYFSYSTDFGHAVRLDNQTTPGTMQLAHGGGNSYSYLNLSYMFSSPTDLSAFNRVTAFGNGTGNGELMFAFTDADGDSLTGFQAMGGVFGDVFADFSTMTCSASPGGACNLDEIVSFEFFAGSFGGTAYAHELRELSLGFTGASGGGPVVTPIPEPSTYALMLLGLGLVAAASHKRRKG